VTCAPHVERNGITRDHFRDNPEWQDIFDLVRSGEDFQAILDKNSSSEIARLWGLAEHLRASETFSPARQIVASVGAEDAAMVTAREATQAVNVGPPRTLATETQKVTPQNSDEPVALTELATELDYASVLPDALPLLLHLDKLKTAEHKRFDMIPGLIAFARDCFALKLDDVHRDAALEGEKESPIAVETDQLSAVSPIMLPPVRALPKPLSVDLPLPDGKDEDSSKLEPARSQLAPIDENTVGERPSAESPPAMLRATDDSLSSATSPADAVPSYNTDPSTKLS